MENTRGGRKTQIEELTETRDLLDSISPSFCLAKWLQHTLYLQNGMNHSCHHPPTHKIPVEEVEANYKALHNTKHKKQAMKQMLEGERPKECDYCWRVEDMGKKYFSDRIYKSKVSWSQPYIYDVMEKGWEEDIEPTYLEISFSNVCNLKCAYCSPDLSSKWMEEIKQHGPYPTHFKHNNLEAQYNMGRMPIPKKDPNPYIDAFWKWWPELYPSLHTLRLTGGEPLMSKDCWRVLEAIKDNPRNDLTLSINTNLDVAQDQIDRLIDLLAEVGPKLKEVQIFTSGEAKGAHAEYVRYGLNYNRWYANCEKVLDALIGKFNFVFAFMTTVNILSISSYDQFYLDVLKLRKKYIPIAMKERNLLYPTNLIPMMTNYLRYPPFLSICNLDTDTRKTAEDKLLKLIENNKLGDRSISETYDFIWDDEVNQILRLIEFMNSSEFGDLDMNRSDFVRFVDEYDKRRNTSFEETYPELHKYYNICVDHYFDKDDSNILPEYHKD